MSYTTGTTMFNSNVLNIIDFQTNVDSAGTTVASAVTGLQTVVNTAEAQINVNSIQPFTSGGNIFINAPLNVEDSTGLTTFSNTTGDAYSLYVYGNVYASNITSIQTIVNTSIAQINADSIQPFTSSGNIAINAPLNIEDSTGLTTFSNTTTGNAYSLYVYGDVYASNYNSLCPLRFTVEGFEAMTIREDGTLIVAGPAVFRGPVEFHGDVTIHGKLIVKETAE